MADLILTADLPTGWEISQSSDGSELKKRFRLEVGDLMVLLEQQLGSRLRLNMLSKKIELDGTPIRAEQYPTLYVQLSKLGYKISKQGAINASRSEVLLVSAPSGPYVLCVITRNQTDQSWGDDNEGFQLLRQLSRLVWNALEPGRPYESSLEGPVWPKPHESISK